MHVHTKTPADCVCVENGWEMTAEVVHSGDLMGMTRSWIISLPEERDGGQGWGHWGDY